MKNLCSIVVIMSVFISLNAVNIKLKNVAYINNSEIKLADITDSYTGDENEFNALKNTTIKHLEYNKKMTNIKSNDVLEVLRKHYPNINCIIVSNVVAVRWNETFLTAETIQSTVETFLRKYYSLSNNAEISLSSIPRVQIPTNDITIEYEKNKFSENSNMTRLDAKVYHEKEIVAHFNVLCKITETINVFQANRSIKKGERITSNDFIKVNVTTSQINELTQVIDDDDYIANKFIAKGANLKKSDIITSPFVKRNELVNVLITSKTLNMNYMAISKEDGWIGDRISLINPDSQQTFQAKVIEKNKVLINLED